LNQKDSFIEGA
jgi:hypothetical protein